MIKKAARPLIRRTAAFLGFCLLWSGLIGPRIISSGLLYKGHFDIYGGLGKALLFGAVAAGLLIYHYDDNGHIPALPAWKHRQLLWLGGSVGAFILAWQGVSRLLTNLSDQASRPPAWWLIGLTHLMLWLSLLLAALGCFGLPGIIIIIRRYRRQLLIALGLSAGFYLFLLVVYAAWRPLATIVLHSVAWLFSLIGLHAAIVPPRSLVFDKFGIQIAQYCSGIESIALFTGLYAVIGLLDWDKFNHRKLLAAFPIALIILFGFNILRIFSLIAAGYYINPHIAFSLFHTYAGMLFFILYSALFWGVMYRRLLRPVNKPKLPRQPAAPAV